MKDGITFMGISYDWRDPWRTIGPIVVYLVDCGYIAEYRGVAGQWENTAREAIRAASDAGEVARGG